jgi:hypothetical protein
MALRGYGFGLLRWGGVNIDPPFITKKILMGFPVFKCGSI